MHSTFDEAIKIGRDNCCSKIGLTHFSTRYIKYVPIRDDYYKDEILFSHDFLSFKLSQLNTVHQYSQIFTPIMEQLEKDEVI